MSKVLGRVTNDKDFVIKKEFIPSKLIKADDHGDNIKWHDKSNNLAMGVDRVRDIYFYAPVYGFDNEVISHNKCFLTKGDIENLYDQIKAIESADEHIGEVEDDLPF